MRKIFLALRNQLPPWRQRAVQSAVKDVEVEQSLQRAKDASKVAVQAIRDAYALADARINGPS